MKLAQALLRRKELQDKLGRINAIREKDVFEVKAQRVKVSDGIDEVLAKIPKLSLSQVTAEYDFYAKQLRNIDAVIQQTNWTTEVETPIDCMSDYPTKEGD